MTSVLLYPSDEGGCGCYRLIWPGAMLANEGIDVETRFSHTFQCWWQPSPLGDQVVDVTEAPRQDVIVWQRPLKRAVVELMTVLQRKYDKTTIVEIDDDFHALPKRHPVREGTNPLVNRELNWDWLMVACDRADLVICSTEALAERYGRHGRVKVIPNYVPARYLAMKRERHDDLVVGWSGSTHSHVWDLKVVKGAVADVMAEHGAQMRVIGPGADVARQLRLGDEPLVCGWVPIEHYPTAYSTLDVAIAPLRQSAFNDAKSYLKVLEAGALGVPCVGSGVREYRRLAETGLGVVVEQPEDWRSELGRLLGDPDYRAEMGERARKIVRERHVMEDHLGLWLEAWEQAWINHREVMRKVS